MINQMRKATILDLIAEEGLSRYQDGIAEGLAVAERIFVWYADNNKKADPASEEVIAGWCQNELTKLRSKLES